MLVSIFHFCGASILFKDFKEPKVISRINFSKFKLVFVHNILVFIMILLCICNMETKLTRSQFNILFMHVRIFMHSKMQLWTFKEFTSLKLINANIVNMFIIHIVHTLKNIKLFKERFSVLHVLIMLRKFRMQVFLFGASNYYLFLFVRIFQSNKVC